MTESEWLMAIRPQNRIPIRRDAVAPFVAVDPLILPAAIPYHRQIHDQWCWAACCQMLLGFLQQADISQCSMASRQFGKECCARRVPQGCNEGCFPEDSYDKFGIRIGQALSRTQQTDLDGELAAGRPVEVYYRWKDGGAHVALVTGRRADGTYDVHDPYFGQGPRSFRRIKSAYGKGWWDSSYLDIALESQ